MAGVVATSTFVRVSPRSLFCEEFSTRSRLQRVRCAQVSTETSALGEKRKYKDSFTDLVFINGCRQAFGRVAGWQVSPLLSHFSLSMLSLNCCREIRVYSDICELTLTLHRMFCAGSSLQSPRSWEDGYEGMVEVSHALARNRNAAEQQAAVLQVRH